MKNYIVIAIFLFVTAVSFGQERYIFNQYVLNPSTINPAANGFNQEHNVLLNYRSTWSGFEGAPQSFAFHYNGRVADRLGMGMYILSDNYANLNTLKGILNFSYTIDAEDYKIGFGLSTEYRQFRLRNIDLADNKLDASDQVLLDQLNDDSYFESSIGIHGQLTNGMMFDIVLPNIIKAPLSDTEEIPDSLTNFGYVLGLGYKFQIQDYDMTMTPSVYINQFDFHPLHVDLNLIMTFLDDRLRSGVMYSLGADNSLGFLIGTKINNLYFNYSYNVSFNALQEYNNGGHELGFGIILDGTMSEKNTNL